MIDQPTDYTKLGDHAWTLQILFGGLRLVGKSVPTCS